MNSSAIASGVCHQFGLFFVPGAQAVFIALSADQRAGVAGQGFGEMGNPSCGPSP